MGRPRRHPFAGRRAFQGKEQGDARPGASEGGAGRNRGTRHGAGGGLARGDTPDGFGSRPGDRGRRTRGGRLRGQEPQLRRLFLRRGRRRAQSPHGNRPQAGGGTGGMGGEGFARRAPRTAVATPAAKALHALRREYPAVEHLRPAARELPQLRAAVGPLRPRAAALRRAEHDAALRNQIPPLGVHRPQRRSVHLRKGGQPLRTLHDRRVPGHLLARMGELPAAVAERHGAVGGDLGVHRGRHQTVDLPLAGRRLAAAARRGAAGARHGEHTGRGAPGELAQPAVRRGIQQRGDRPHRLGG